MGTAELYDPTSGTWTATASIAAGRIGHTAVLVADGRVLVAGGSISTGLLASAAPYDPGNGT